MKQKLYIVQWNRDDYGHIEILAKSQKEAEEKFMQGNFLDVNLIIDGGNMEIEHTCKN